MSSGETAVTKTWAYCFLEELVAMSCGYLVLVWFPPPLPCGGSDGKASAYNVGNLGSIPGSGRSPGEGNGNPLQYSCLENPMDRGAWLATVMGLQRVEHNWATSLHYHTASAWGAGAHFLTFPGAQPIQIYQLCEMRSLAGREQNGRERRQEVSCCDRTGWTYRLVCSRRCEARLFWPLTI